MCDSQVASYNKCTALIDASSRWCGALKCQPACSFPAAQHWWLTHRALKLKVFIFFSPSLWHIKFAGAYHELTVDWISCFKGGMLIFTGWIHCRTEKHSQAEVEMRFFCFFCFFESTIEKRRQERFTAAQAKMEWGMWAPWLPLPRLFFFFESPLTEHDGSYLSLWIASLYFLSHVTPCGKEDEKKRKRAEKTDFLYLI